MQSLLSTVHHSLTATRATFTLRVFVSYDALGRRKDSLVVDIEQPRPPPSLITPRHTIRILTPAAPLHAASLHIAPPSLVPVTPRPSTLPPSHSSITLSPFQSTHASPSTTCVNGSVPSVVAAPFSPLARPLPHPAAPSPWSTPLAAVACPVHFPASATRSPTHFAGSLPAAPPFPSSAARPDAVLTLPPHGATSAVNDEMDCRGGVDEESCVPTSSSGSVPTSGPASGPTSGPSSGGECASAASRSASGREKRNRKRRERKQRAKTRAQEHTVEKEVDRSKEEKTDVDDDGESLSRLPDDGMVTVDVPSRLLSAESLKTEYGGRLAVVLQSGCIVSVGTYRRLETLTEKDIQLLEGAGRDWASEYARDGLIALRVCVSDADLPVEDDYCSDDDVKCMDAQ